MRESGGQSASVTGTGNLVIQVTGHGNTVLDPARPHLALRTYETPFWTEPNQGTPGSPGYTALGQQETDLLSPFTRSFALLGRDAVLDRLGEWLEGPGVSVHVLTGAGGRGKTRLAVELCRVARGRGFLAGFAPGEEMARFRAQAAVQDWGWKSPLLVVVDYAGAKAAQIGAWLRDLLHHPALHDPAHPPLRLLLLDRQGGRDGAWWREAFGAPRAERLVAAEAPLALPMIEAPEERWRLFAEAYARAAGSGAPGRDAALDAVLARVSSGGEPLLLGMFGLIAARLGLDVASGLASDELALRMADEELERIRLAWMAAGGGRHGDADLHTHLAALATLSEGWTAAEALAAIERECATLHLGATAPETLRAALHRALPGEGRDIAPVVPDLLGGALAIRAWGGGEAGIAAIRRARAAKPAAVARSVIRACQDFLIRGRQEPLAWLHAVRADITDLEGLMALSDAMPKDTVELREAAVDLNEYLVMLLRGLVDSELGTALLAIALNKLAVRLSALGRWEPALAAIKEAVGLERALASARPDAFLPALAGSLNNLSNCLSDMGWKEQGLAAIDEAVGIQRRLAATQPNAFLPDLALSLNNLSNSLSDLGRREAALATMEEVVGLFRSMAAAHPDAFLPDLAGSLNNLSNHLSALNRREAALAASEEAVGLYRRLAVARPDSFLPNLATSLITLSNSLSDLGRREAALGFVEEAVGIRRTLAAARPDAFLSDLALSLNNLSNRLSDLSRWEAALATIEEAVGIQRRFAAARPDAALPGLARAIHNLSIHLSALGRWAAALAASEEAVGIYRPLAAARPDANLPDLAASLNSLSNNHSNLGHQAAALAAIEEAVDIRRRLAAARPDAFVPDLATSYGAWGAALRGADETAAAARFADGIIALRAPFLALPTAFQPLMNMLLQDYMAATAAAGLQPDEVLLAPVLAKLQNMAPPGGAEEAP